MNVYKQYLFVSHGHLVSVYNKVENVWVEHYNFEEDVKLVFNFATQSAKIAAKTIMNSYKVLVLTESGAVYTLTHRDSKTLHMVRDTEPKEDKR
jgi:outer membrane protein assembly factor BamB